MNFLQQALSYIFTGANWGGPSGLTARILEHLTYTAVAVFFSALIAIPLGMLIGHTRKGTFVVVTGVNALRALPTLGVLLLGVLLWGLGLVPPTVALMLLGIPPLLAGTYAGWSGQSNTALSFDREHYFDALGRPAGSTVQHLIERVGAEHDVWLAAIDGRPVPFSRSLVAGESIDCHEPIEGG